MRGAQLARAQGDFLLVGLHTDEAVSERRGAHLPIMDLHERALSVLACRYVNEVIIGARARPLCCLPRLPLSAARCAEESSIAAYQATTPILCLPCCCRSFEMGSMRIPCLGMCCWG
jgi:hypothetical protein